MLSRAIGDAELRALEPWQAAELAAFTERHRDHLGPWLPWARSVVDEQTARAFLQRYADATAADGGRIYGLWRGGDMVGGTLFRIFEPRSGTCEIGVWLSPDATGQGLVTRAVEAMVEWAVDVRGMRRVEWRCVPQNEPSRATARRIGFTHEGTLRQAFAHDGRLWDLEVWALLASDR
ncbi:GNAT family N-acetyltransferase [Nocardioides sp. MAH-18]|uniref:GNAT family N-acetyltransferase n=1 Tax=Nocardioides agri TaxID=2682843 RepID=A0A6L6XWZ9_9ACTN|nr:MULTISPECIES: GNAT family protein [unclassified Nocardioides]MBA2956384.1 GNAT family N-acetyltransferase [Nocardioides sp. CGMCC 1.13656]MVQ51227.1 GNAT family N-acetyltransferase [Nocardioides sp. MAH-18]